MNDYTCDHCGKPFTSFSLCREHERTCADLQKQSELPRFQTEAGLATDDGQRAMWYGNCGYWTDDWAKLATSFNGIPCCPDCGTPGFQTTVTKWMQGATKFEADGHFGYRNFIKWLKENCLGRGASIMATYEASEFPKGPRRG